MDIFINKAITNGIEAYNNKNAGKDYSSSHYYELTIIEILTKIYDRVSIIIPYKTKYEKNFINNLKIYGLSNEDTNLFITSLEEYDNWLTNKTGTTTNSVDNIHLILIKMILLKNLYKPLSKEEIDYYDYYLNAKEIRFKKIISLASNDIDEVIKVWNHKKNVYLSNKVYKLTEIEPDLLSKTMYEKHGISINQVKQLSNLKVNEINNIIVNNEKNIKERSNFNPFKLVLTSGNGIVDTLVLFCIVITEIFIGFLIAILG